ncbi:DUF2946 family protein [Pseudophaeobacter arcticus]
MTHRLLSYVMLLAIAAAGLLPAGWMPAHASDGRVLLVICSDDGLVERWVDLDDGDAQQDNHDRQMDKSNCPFAGLSNPADLPQHSPVLLGSTMPSLARWAHEEFTHHPAGLHWRYDARGPPALS